MQRSSTARRASADSVPALCAARASANSRGRSRLPTWSARNGGRLRGPALALVWVTELDMGRTSWVAAAVFAQRGLGVKASRAQIAAPLPPL